MIGILKRRELSPYEQGYQEASSKIETVKLFGQRRVLEGMGILPPEWISDNYDFWNPAADRTTELRFGGSDHDFYAFQDGAEVALSDLCMIQGVDE